MCIYLQKVWFSSLIFIYSVGLNNTLSPGNHAFPVDLDPSHDRYTCMPWKARQIKPILLHYTADSTNRQRPNKVKQTDDTKHRKLKNLNLKVQHLFPKFKESLLKWPHLSLKHPSRKNQLPRSF
jgi:hypothetical protein